MALGGKLFTFLEAAHDLNSAQGRLWADIRSLRDELKNTKGEVRSFNAEHESNVSLDVIGFLNRADKESEPLYETLNQAYASLIRAAYLADLMEDHENE